MSVRATYWRMLTGHNAMAMFLFLKITVLIFRCCLALQEKDSAGLQAMSASIRGRGVRISEVVTQEMDSFEAGDYSDRVREAVRLLQTELIPNYESHVMTAVTGVEEGYKV